MNLYKVNPKSHINHLRYMGNSSCGAVYPLSIAEGFQHGEIYESADRKSVFLRHHCGFAFLSGTCDVPFSEAVYGLLINETRRCVLFAEHKEIVDFFSEKSGITIEQRYFFAYRNAQPVYPAALPDGFVLYEMDAAILSRIQGKITPAFSWRSDEEFLEKGKGFCIMHGENICAWAFTSAVSSKEIDIGVETSLEYRNQGLAAIASARMIRYILEQQKTPVWACHAQNAASQALAKKIGFEKTAECFTIRKEGTL